MSILIKNGNILLDDRIVKRDILIIGNRIEKIEENISSADKVLDASGCFVMPGAVDVHVHLREPGFSHKETIQTGTLAAAKGGITTVLAMPNIIPCPDCLENLAVEQQIIKESAQVRVFPYGAVSKGQKGQVLADIEQLSKHVLAITDDGVGVNNIELLEQGMHLAKKWNLVIASHAEDSINGKLPEGEYKAVERECEIAKRIGCRYHFCHLSTKRSFDAIRKAHQQGYKNVTCEVSPHHLFLNQKMIQNGNWKMNPPLRSEEDRIATIEALLDGTASIIASDHAPHTIEEKNQSYEHCPNGILGLETMIPLVYTHLIATKRASIKQFIEWFIENPAKVFNLPIRKLEKNEVADITVLDITNRREYRIEEILSLSKNSPYVGQKLTGFPKYTLVDGKIVYEFV